jgi:mono/diheme cytochrome c family protein
MSSTLPFGPLVVASFALAAAAACGTSESRTAAPRDWSDGGTDGAVTEVPDAARVPDADAEETAIPTSGIAIPPSPQRSGDPAKGYRTLVNGGYVSLGIPWSGFSFAMSSLDPRDALPGREGKNALVGYSFNVSTNSRGIEVAAPNCLSCHATHLRGKLIVGLGRPAHSLALPSGIATDPALISLGLTNATELSEYQDFGSRLLISQDSGTLLVFGALASHRDPATLEWSPLTTRFSAATGLRGWVDVPPWWRTKKKNGLYATGMGRGDHVRHMMNMTLFSCDSVAEASAIDAMFVDVASYLRSTEPPKYPAAIDTSLATQGEQIFDDRCASCHGTYVANPTYPNLLFPVAAIGTDPELAQKQWVTTGAVDWFASSFYASSGARLEPLAGYVAPPLDGIWATAPFFHNGSVPTLEGVLDSTKRPGLWRSSFGDDDYDLDAVGWTPSATGDPYDTTLPGFANGGHTFGDALTETERRALLEYLKTL